jgi:hypothetical protein
MEGAQAPAEMPSTLKFSAFRQIHHDSPHQMRQTDECAYFDYLKSQSKAHIAVRGDKKHASDTE